MFILKHEDTPLAKFNYVYLGHVTRIYDVEFFDENKEFYPVYLKQHGADDYSLYKWICKRALSSHRCNYFNIVDQLLHTTARHPIDIICQTKGLSLNDHFWVVPEDFKGKFEDYNLHTHIFDQSVMPKICMGEFMIPDRSLELLTPEATTLGNLAKAWIINNQGLPDLIKGSTLKYSKLDENVKLIKNEPICEYIAWQVADCMGFNSIPYDLNEFNGKLVSTCPCFTTNSTGFVPAAEFRSDLDIYEWADFIDENFGTASMMQFEDMIILDSLILNTDRHLNNFGFVKDNKTEKILGFAPIFDNGNSLLCELSPEDWSKKSKVQMALLMANHRSGDFIQNAILMMSDRHIEGLTKVSNIVLKNHDKYPIDENQLKGMQDIIRDQAKTILKDYKKNCLFDSAVGLV